MSSSDESGSLRLTRRSWLLAAAAAVATSPVVEAQSGLRLLRAEDQSTRDRSLQSLLGEMRAIVRHKDSRALCVRMAPDFKVEFDVGKGPDVFREYWKPDASTSAVWVVLDRLLSLGGTFYSPSLFAVPYVYTRFPQDLDRLSHVVATGEVPMVADPNPPACGLAC